MDILIEELEDSLWVAAIDNKKLVGLELDPIGELVRWGSVYNARVKRIDTALDAAFLDLGEGQTGILYARDVRFQKDDGTIEKSGGKPIGKLVDPGQKLMVQAKSTALFNDSDDDLPLEDKSPKMSMDITLPGRYLIYTPLSKQNRVSRRIKDPALRKKVKTMVDKVENVQGCILRAAAANCQTDVLIREGNLLKAAWGAVMEEMEKERPGLIMSGPNAIIRMLSDMASAHINKIELVTLESFQITEKWCSAFAPDLMTKINPIETEGDMEALHLFEHYGLIEQIEDLLQPYVLLNNSGGNLIIQETAAMTVIDVNSSQNNSPMEFNKKAADEVARHIRLRNLGGIIVVDFLKLRTAQQKKKFMDYVQHAFDGDPCTVTVHGMTNLGLVEITRSRRSAKLSSRFESA